MAMLTVAAARKLSTAPSNSVLCCSAAESLDGSVGEISGFSRVKAGSKFEKSVVPPEMV